MTINIVDTAMKTTSQKILLINFPLVIGFLVCSKSKKKKTKEEIFLYLLSQKAIKTMQSSKIEKFIK
jgi:hypothetical protein